MPQGHWSVGPFLMAKQKELLNTLRMGGSGAVTAFVENCVSIHEAGGGDAVSKWVTLALPELPEPERAALVTLLVVVDPPGVVPIYVALTSNEQPARRRKILIRAVLIAFGVALFFLIAGRAVLSYLGVTVHAFSISGGILLFVAAMPMLFGQRGGLQAPEGKELGARAAAGKERAARSAGQAGTHSRDRHRRLA